MRNKKAKIGDICEIKTPAGMGYVQYTHEHPTMAQLVRVLPGLYPTRPDLKELAQRKELYFTFFALDYSLRDGPVEIVSNEPVPKWAQAYPIMRFERERDQNGKVLNWLIGDSYEGVNVTHIPKMLNVKELSAEQKKLSIHSLWPYQTMVKELARGWTPERDEEFCLQDMAAADARRKAGNGEPVQAPIAEVIDHYLYFPKKANAEKAAEELRKKDWIVEVKMGADGENWLALAKQSAPIEEDIEEVRDELERLADDLGGEYDGWGAAM